jgi:hypothetical protein
MRRISVILDSKVVNKHTYDFIIDLKKSAILEFETLIIQNVNNKRKKINLMKNIRDFSFLIIFRLERLFLMRFFVDKTFSISSNYKKYDISSLFAETIYLNPILSSSGLIYRFKTSEIDLIKSYNFDLIIRGGSGIYKGEILEVTKMGILGFHHGDNKHFRGGPFGFWEVYHKSPYTSFIIQKLNKELDGGDVLFKSSIETQPLYSLNALKILSHSSHFLRPIIELYLSEKSMKYNNDYSPYDDKLYKSPKLYHQFNYLIYLVILIMTRIYMKIFKIKERWSVSYLYIDDWRRAVLNKSKRIKNPKGAFLADPFALKKDNDYFVFAEEFNYSENKGRIVVYQLKGNSSHRLGIALNESFHLSFPFIFVEDGDYYMIPESHQSNDIRLYKCKSFPLEWKLENILISNIQAVDSIIFKSESYWYLITNQKIENNADFSTNLSVFYSKKFNSQSWDKLEINIKNTSDLRNGGLIRSGDSIYRVSQNNGFNHYGKSININKILNINTLDYLEKYYSTIKPSFSKNAKGIHTLNYDKGILVFDTMSKESYVK